MRMMRLLAPELKAEPCCAGVYLMYVGASFLVTGAEGCAAWIFAKQSVNSARRTKGGGGGRREDKRRGGLLRIINVRAIHRRK